MQRRLSNSSNSSRGGYGPRNPRGDSYAAIISRFTANSLSTKTFRWLHAEAWEDRHLEFFLRERPTEPSNLIATVPFVTGRKHTPPEMAGRWLLEAPIGGALLAWVEIQAYVTSFTTIHILASKYFDGRAAGFVSLSWDKDAADALSLMISAIIIMADADVIRVFPAGREADQDFAGLAAAGWGATAKVWSPAKELAVLANAASSEKIEGPVGFSAHTLTIDPVSWWQTEWGARDRKTLAYLDKRRAATQSTLQGRPRQKRKSLFARLLRWS